MEIEDILNKINKDWSTYCERTIGEQNSQLSEEEIEEFKAKHEKEIRSFVEGIDGIAKIDFYGEYARIHLTKPLNWVSVTIPCPKDMKMEEFEKIVKESVKDTMEK